MSKTQPDFVLKTHGCKSLGFQFGWSTGPMTEPGFCVKRSQSYVDDNEFSAGGCFSIENAELLIEYLRTEIDKASQPTPSDEER